MNKTILAALVAASQLLLAKPATAITYRFSWRSDADGLTSRSELVHEATGTVDINVVSGQSFTAANISNVNITVTNGTNSFRLSDAFENTRVYGNVSSDGTTASLTDFFFGTIRRFPGSSRQSMLNFGC